MSALAHDPDATPAAREPALAIALRELTWPDLARLAQLETQLFAEDAWTEATWWAELAQRPRRDYVVAVPLVAGSPAEARDANIAGYAGLDHGGATADIMTVAVAPAYRGTGVGDTLVGELLARAAARGAESVLLEVRADNRPAIALYERHGFVIISTRRRYYQPGDVDALVMRRLL